MNCYLFINLYTLVAPLRMIATKDTDEFCCHRDPQWIQNLICIKTLSEPWLAKLFVAWGTFTFYNCDVRSSCVTARAWVLSASTSTECLLVLHGRLQRTFLISLSLSTCGALLQDPRHSQFLLLPRAACSGWEVMEYSAS